MIVDLLIQVIKSCIAMQLTIV